jgi:putative intracellular protease/amidase
MHAQIMLYDGFDELDVVAPYEVLQVAAAVGAPGRVELVTLDGAPEVAGAYGLRLRPQARIEPGSSPDLLLVPGGGDGSPGWRGGSEQRWRAASSRP